MSLPGAAPSGTIDWRWALPRIALVFVATRLLLLGVAVAVEATQPAPPDGVRADERPIVASFTAWDGVYYLDIADEGYQAEADPFPNYAFFPGYPQLARAVGTLTGDVGISAVVLANVAFAVALVVLYALSVRHLAPDRAIWSLWFLALAPGAIAFGMAYPESLFLLCAAAAFLAAETRHHWLAGLALGAATLTRAPGILLLLPLLLVYIDRDGPRPTRAWLPLAVAPIALAGFFGYLWWLTGDPLAPISAQSFWDAPATTPDPAPEATPDPAGTATGEGAVMGMGSASTLVIALWVGTLAFYSFLLVFFRHDRMRPAYWALAILAIASIFLAGRLQSAPRYLAVAWPFDWVLANRRSLLGRSVVLAAFGVLYVVLAWLAFDWRVPP